MLLLLISSLQFVKRGDARHHVASCPTLEGELVQHEDIHQSISSTCLTTTFGKTLAVWRSLPRFRKMDSEWHVTSEKPSQLQNKPRNAWHLQLYFCRVVVVLCFFLFCKCSREFCQPKCQDTSCKTRFGIRQDARTLHATAMSGPKLEDATGESRSFSL